MPLDQNALLEGRIIELLTTTNLTFKEIILKLDSENLSASIGIIRRINRDNRYRRPRYDSKLTPAQRESLVDELRDHQGAKPNLSLLAKRYGVCHGSVWYWWDKLNRIRRCENSLLGSDGNTGAGLVGGTSPGSSSSAGLFGKSRMNHNHQRERHSNFNRQHAHYRHHDGQQQLQHQFKTHNKSMFKRSYHLNVPAAASKSTGHHLDLTPASQSSATSPLLLDDRYKLIGRVSLVTRNNLNVIYLPVLMFSKRTGARSEEAPVGLTLGPAIPEVQVASDKVLFASDQDERQQRMYRCGGATVI